MKGKKIAFIICLATLITVGSLIYAFTSSHTRYPEWMEPLADMIEEEAPKWVSFGAELIDIDFDNIPEVFVSTSSTAGAVICNAYKFDGATYKEWNLPENAGLAEIILVVNNQGEKRWIGHRFSAKNYYLIEYSTLEPKEDGIHAENLLTVYGDISDIDSSYIMINSQSIGLGRREKEAISNDIPPENIFVQKYIDDMWSSLGKRIEYKTAFVRNAIFTGSDKIDRSVIIKDILQWEKT
jgi:hypothetical protein